MPGSRSLKGTKIYIGPEAPADLDQAGYEALSFTEIIDAGSISEFGGTSARNTYPTLKGGTLKSKGAFDAGNIEIEMARNTDDAGQAALRAAGLTDASYAIKVEYPDETATKTPSIFYSRGLVDKVRQMGGGSDNFALEGTTVDLEQDVIEVPPANKP